MIVYWVNWGVLFSDQPLNFQVWEPEANFNPVLVCSDFLSTYSMGVNLIHAFVYSVSICCWVDQLGMMDPQTCQLAYRTCMSETLLPLHPPSTAFQCSLPSSAVLQAWSHMAQFPFLACRKWDYQLCQPLRCMPGTSAVARVQRQTADAVHFLNYVSVCFRNQLLPC